MWQARVSIFGIMIGDALNATSLMFEIIIFCYDYWIMHLNTCNCNTFYSDISLSFDFSFSKMFIIVFYNQNKIW